MTAINTFHKIQLIALKLKFKYFANHVAWCPHPVPQSSMRSLGLYLAISAIFTIVHLELNGLPHMPFDCVQLPASTRS